ncbi:MAG: phosphatase PAP2 family protein [Sphingobacteriaceae bacterium]|nr:MAG: phosphatase PAP2 family protein [Sphingobacteriaceae bacterium]
MSICLICTMKIGIKDVLNRINLFFILYLVILAACLIIKLLYSRDDIYFAVNSHYNYTADTFFTWFTNVGDGLFTVSIAILLALFYSYRKAFLLITSYGVTSLVAQILKHWFDAPRPKLYFGDQLSHIHFVEDLYVPSLHSFPSGHSVTVFSTAVVLTYLCRQKGWGLLFWAIAVATAYSRMYLSAHFFEDVVAGSVIGVIVTVLWLTWLDSKPFLHTGKWDKSLTKKRT